MGSLLRVIDLGNLGMKKTTIMMRRLQRCDLNHSNNRLALVLAKKLGLVNLHDYWLRAYCSLQLRSEREIELYGA